MKATQLGLTVTPSEDSNCKIDVYKNGQLVARVGNINEPDYAWCIDKYGLRTAGKMKTRYHQEHAHIAWADHISGHWIRNDEYYRAKLLW